MSNPFLSLGKSSLAQLERALDAAAEDTRRRIVHLTVRELGRDKDPNAVVMALARLGGELDAVDNMKKLVYAANQGGT